MHAPLLKHLIRFGGLFVGMRLMSGAADGGRPGAAEQPAGRPLDNAPDAARHPVLRQQLERQLQRLGLAPHAAQARVAAMTERDVLVLARELQSLPGAADEGGWRSAGLVVLTALLLVVAL